MQRNKHCWTAGSTPWQNLSLSGEGYEWCNEKISRSNLKDSRSRDPIPPNVDRDGALSIPNIEVQDAPSGAEQDPQLPLQTAKEAIKDMNLLSGLVTSAASTAQDAPADLEAAYNVQDTYLRPLKIFDSVIGELADICTHASQLETN